MDLTGTFNQFIARYPLLTMGQIFQTDRREAVNEDYSIFSAQCACFVYFCLYAQQGRYEKAFVEFANEASRGAVTEATFKALFKR